MSLADPVVITCAISGAIADRSQCPAIPYTPEEYAAEARRIVDEGGVHIHIHARSPDGRPSYAAEDFVAIRDAIRAAGGRPVVRLEYEVYGEMAERVFADVAAEARRKFAVLAAAIHHRTGSLAVGEVSVIIAVSAAHRAAAFDACRFIIDRIKQVAPIWKKEHSPAGAVWIDEGA